MKCIQKNSLTRKQEMNCKEIEIKTKNSYTLEATYAMLAIQPRLRSSAYIHILCLDGPHPCT